MAIIIRSERMSVAENTVRTSRLSMHSVRKIPIGAQFNDQRVPHWKSVVKKNASVHATVKPIITQHRILNRLEDPKSRFQRSSSEILIKPKQNFSVIWKAYLYFCATASSGIHCGQPSTTGECPVIAPSIVAPKNIPLSPNVNN